MFPQLCFILKAFITMLSSSNLVSFLICLFISFSLFSQKLYIGSTGEVSVDPGHYLYVNDNVIINDSGNLIAQSNASSSASLLVSGNVTGKITYKRYIPDANWHLVASPVSGQSIPAFVENSANNNVATSSSTNNYAVAYYKNINNAGQRWTYHHASPSAANQETLANFVNGKGYSTKRTSEGEFTFKGDMLTADLNVDLTTNGSHYWYSIGNPYPAYLLANSNDEETNNVFGQNASILDSNYAGLYFWDGATYQVINLTTPGAHHIVPGQAFMVRAKSDSETFTFKKSLTSHQTGTDRFYRNANTTPNIVVSLFNGTQTKTTEIKYLANATSGLDVGYDAGAYQDGQPEFSLNTHLITDSTGLDFMLQCLPNNNYEDLVVPLSVRANANIQLSFTAASTNLPQGLSVYLEDKENNTLEDITSSPYQVTTSQQLNGIGRFYLHTSFSVLSTEDLASSLSSINMYTTEKHTLRITGLESQDTSTIIVHDILGKQVFTHDFKANIVTDIALPISLKTGIYLVNLSSMKGVVSKKIMIK